MIKIRHAQLIASLLLITLMPSVQGADEKEPEVEVEIPEGLINGSAKSKYTTYLKNIKYYLKCRTTSKSEGNSKYFDQRGQPKKDSKVMDVIRLLDPKSRDFSKVYILQCMKKM